MDFKILLLVFIQLIISINLSEGLIPIKILPITRRLPILPTLPPVAVPNFVNCTQFSNTRDYWVSYTYNGVPSRDCFLYPGINSYASSWHNAYDYCRYKNASLLSIHDHNANYILSHPLRLRYGTGEILWIGLTSLYTRRGVYKWSDGTAVSMFNYATTTSSGDRLPPNIKDQGRCVSMRVTAQISPLRNYYKNIGQWFKDDCNLNHRFICKKNSSPPPTPPPLPKGGCPAGWYNANQKCIKYFAQPLTFQQAKDKCSQQTNGQNTGELLTVHSQAEQDFLTSLSGTGIKAPYIGLNRLYLNSAWKWSDQSRFDYGNFGIQPSATYYQAKFCSIMVTNSSQPGKWVDVYCSDKHPFICEVLRTPGVNAGTNFLTKKCNITGFGNGFVQYRDSCYSIVNKNKLSYLDAENHCKSLGAGAHLTSIVDIYEEAFLRNYVSQTGKPSDMYLIGLQSKAQSDTNDTQYFGWSDGWPVYYTDWMYQEPKLLAKPADQCVILTSNNKISYYLGNWKTVRCDTPYSYLCKVSKRKVPNVSSITNGVCPKIVGNKDKTLDWVNLHKGLQYCYWFSADRRSALGYGAQTWSDASFHCRRRNGTLVSFHSKHDQTLIVNRATRYNYFGGIWIGLSRKPTGELAWEDSSPIDFTNWAPGEKYKNITNLNDDSGRVCVEMSTDKVWKQVACSGNKRNYFVCQTKKLFASSDSSPSHGGRTAGIVIGVILGIGAVVGIGIYVMRRNNLNMGQMPSFENPLSRGTATGNKPQEFHNNNPSSSDLTHTASNDSPFANKSFE